MSISVGRSGLEAKMDFSVVIQGTAGVRTIKGHSCELPFSLNLPKGEKWEVTMLWEGILPRFSCGVTCKWQLTLWTWHKTSQQALGEPWQLPELKPWVTWRALPVEVQYNFGEVSGWLGVCDLHLQVLSNQVLWFLQLYNKSAQMHSDNTPAIQTLDNSRILPGCM